MHRIHKITSLLVALFLTAALLTMPAGKPAQAGAGGWYVRLTADKTEQQADGTSVVNFTVSFYVLACKNGTYSYHPYSCVNNGGYDHDEPVVPGGGGPVGMLNGLVGTANAGGAGEGSSTPPSGIQAYADITVTGSGNILSDSRVENDSAGKATFTLKSTVAEAKTITAAYSYTDEGGNQTPSSAVAVTFKKPAAASNSTTTTPTRNSTTTEPATPEPPTAKVSMDGQEVAEAEKIEIEENESLHLSGKTVANGKITLYIYSEPKTATVFADQNGDWSHDLTGLEPGEHRVEAEVTDPVTGKTSPRTQLIAFAVKAAAAVVAEPVDAASSGLPWWQWLIIGVGGVAITGILTWRQALGWYRSRRGSNTPVTPA